MRMRNITIDLNLTSAPEWALTLKVHIIRLYTNFLFQLSHSIYTEKNWCAVLVKLVCQNNTERVILLFQHSKWVNFSTCVFAPGFDLNDERARYYEVIIDDLIY